MVWDYEQKEELVFVHGIDKNKIKVIGSSTFHHVHDYVKKKEKKKNHSSVSSLSKIRRKKNALFVMATGVDQLVQEELLIFDYLFVPQ